VLASSDSRDAKIHHLDIAGAGHHHVARFEVAVHDPGRMRVL
jgi:hypothetical protein